MKKILLFAFLLFAGGVFAQTPYDTVNVRDPQNFVEMTSVDTAYFQLIGRKANLNRRMSLTTLKNWILSGVSGIDSVYYIGDQLNILQGSTLWQATTGRVADSLVLSNDSLFLYENGTSIFVDLAGISADSTIFATLYALADTAAAIRGDIPAPDGNGLFDAANDGDTTGIGSVVLGEDLTVDLNSYDWLFDGLVEDDTTRKIMTLRGDGSLAYRWLDSLLNGYTTGSGTPGTLPIWTGGNALGNSSVTESGGNVIGTSFTGAFGLATGTTAQAPVGANGRVRYNTTENGISAWNGAAAAWRYLPWADADNFSQYHIPYSNGNQLTSNSYFTFGDASSVTHSVRSLSSTSTHPIFRVLNNSGAVQFEVLQNGRLGIGTAAPGDSEARVGGRLRVEGDVLFSATATGRSISWESLNMSIYESSNNLVVSASSGYSALAYSGTAYGMAASKSSYPRFYTRNGVSNYLNDTMVYEGAIDWTNFSKLPPTIYRGSRVPRTGTYFEEEAGDTWILGGNPSSQAASVAGEVWMGSYQNGNPYPDSIRWGLKIQSNTGLPFFPQHGVGTITGTHAYSASFNSAGKLIEVPEKWASISTSTDGSGDITVAHGMGTTPTSVQVTVTGTTPYIVTVHTIDATNFTVRFFDTSGAAVVSTAVTATWHCKT